MKTTRPHWDSAGYGLWGIFRQNQQQNDLPDGLLGIIWLEETDDRPSGTTDIGYALTPPAWGKGIAIEAAQKVIDYAFQDVGVLAVDALIFGNINPGSVKLFKRLGGQFVGKKPFEEYGGQEWFEMCHRFDLWLIETADASMLDGRVMGACYRTGQFVAEAYLTKHTAEKEIENVIASNSALQSSDTVMDIALSALKRGCSDAGWSHYRIVNPAL